MIAGAGGIGKAAGLILACEKSFPCRIFIGDMHLSNAQEASDYINSGSESHSSAAFHLPADGVSEKMKDLLDQSDIVLDCLPGAQAPRLAKLARDFHCHYANLTEYVAETGKVKSIAENADTGFVLQTGLAPGFINVLAMYLFHSFRDRFDVDQVESISMKTGALSKHAPAPHYYAFTWSSIGVATEYVKSSFVVRDYKTITLPSLSDTSKIIIDGQLFEDDFTSGGAADLPQALQGKVKNLDYKTLRHPGHYKWAKNTLKQCPEENKIECLHKKMVQQIPMVDEDMVVIYASVTGFDQQGKFRAIEKSYKIFPKKVGLNTLRAIQTTTAAPLCETAKMLLTSQMRGAIFQSQLNPDAFLNGAFVTSVFGSLKPVNEAVHHAL